MTGYRANNLLTLLPIFTEVIWMSDVQSGPLVPVLEVAAAIASECVNTVMYFLRIFDRGVTTTPIRPRIRSLELLSKAEACNILPKKPSEPEALSSVIGKQAS